MSPTAERLREIIQSDTGYDDLGVRDVFAALVRETGLRWTHVSSVKLRVECPIDNPCPDCKRFDELWRALSVILEAAGVPNDRSER